MTQVRVITGATILLFSFVISVSETPFSCTRIKADDKTFNEPKSLQDGFAHLERILGPYNTDDQVEWRVPTIFDKKHKPDPSQSEILLVLNGLRMVGHPFRGPESLSFDEVAQWQKP